MLIKSYLTPTSFFELNCKNAAINPPTQQIRKLQGSCFKISHRHQQQLQQQQLQQHHQVRLHFQRQRQQRCILFLIALILLQQVELHECRQLSQRNSHRLITADKSTDSSSLDLLNNAENFDLPQSKRAELRQSPNIGQPEEIFTIDDRMESNYDEYPMIVPKRAALLLDRLMVALHNALEKDREIEQSRIGELNPKYKNGKDTDSNTDDEADLEAGVPQFDHMYGDDPTVMMDYDFKDLNSINRATGETFFGKNLQRRAKMGSGGDSMAMLASSMATGATTRATGKSLTGGGGGGGSGVVGGGGGRLNTGRLYWRCYFNAITCF